MWQDQSQINKISYLRIDGCRAVGLEGVKTLKGLLHYSIFGIDRDNTAQ